MSVHLLDVQTRGQGLFEFTDHLQQLISKQGITEGLCSLLIQHTSASLTIQENADPSARRDLENWLNRLVPERDPLFTHTLEGDDDMPAHIKAALTAASLSVPVAKGRLLLGTWQGVYVWEHRHGQHRRQIAVHLS